MEKNIARPGRLRYTTRQGRGLPRRRHDLHLRRHPQRRRGPHGPQVRQRRGGRHRRRASRPWARAEAQGRRDEEHRPVGTTWPVRDRIRAHRGPGHPLQGRRQPRVPQGRRRRSTTSTSPTAWSSASRTSGSARDLPELYDPFVRNGHPIYLMDVLSAEMVKYAPTTSWRPRSRSSTRWRTSARPTAPTSTASARACAPTSASARVPLPRPGLRRLVLPQGHARLHHDGRQGRHRGHAALQAPSTRSTRSSATASSTRSSSTSAARRASAAASPACRARRSPSGASPSSPRPTTSARPPP
jgi:hypothetical protein